jgi:hypothetical protein
LTAVNLDQPLAGSLYVLGLIAEKSRRMNIAFQLFLRRGVEVTRPFVFAKEVGRDDIYAIISALSRKDRSDEKLEGVRMLQSAMCIWIRPF